MPHDTKYKYHILVTHYNTEIENWVNKYLEKEPIICARNV